MKCRTCDELGLCQVRTPRCRGCMPRPIFAPGVIEHHRKRHMRHLARWAGRALGLLCVAAVVGAAVSLLRGI